MSGFDNYIRSLPMPLSREEQDVLLRQYFVTKDENIRELLITHNLRLVASIVCDFVGEGDLDDLMQVGTIELMSCLDRYDVTKGFEFSTYAYACIRGKLNKEITPLQRSSDAIHRTQPNIVGRYSKSDDEVDIFDIIPDDSNFVGEIGQFSEIEDLLSILNDREKYIIERSFGLCNKPKLTLRQMELQLGISRTHINNLQKVAIEKLKRYYSDKENYIDLENIEIMAVVEYLKTTNNQEYIYALEHRYGLNGREKIPTNQIVEKLSKGRNYITRLVNKIVVDYVLRHGQQSVKIEDVYLYLDKCNNETTKLVIEYIYGLNGKEKLSNKEIASIVGVSSDYVKDVKKNTTERIIKLKMKGDLQKNQSITEDILDKLN